MRTAGRGRPRNGMSREDRRAELLSAATTVIRREGPSASMDAIARAAGVTKPVLYQHFGDKAGLRSALATQFGNDLVVALRATLVQDADPRSLLHDTIDTFVSFIDADPEVYRFLLSLPVQRDSGGGDLMALAAELSQDVAVVLGEQLRAAGVDSGAAEPWAHGILGLVYLAGDWWMQRRTMPRARLVEYLTALLWDGLSGAGLQTGATATDGSRR